MAVLERLGAAELRSVVRGYRDALRAHQETINRLNVYPVPDGDTGTNMALTLESVCQELDGADDGMPATCKAISHGSLMGARGNSGVILSQVLRGMVEVLRDAEGADGPVFAAALTAASEAAYGAVMRPVEGTILTVVREAAEGATTAAKEDGAGLCAVVEAARVQGSDALARTPDLLPVLKDAGVVDAGGAGFVLLLDVLLHELDGRGVPEPDPTTAAPDLVAAASGGDDEHHVGDLRYEVMYFLEAPDETIPAFKDVWAGIGDSIVVVGGDGIWNCHIHTDDIGAAVEAALDCGRPRTIRVTDLLEQVEEERWVRDGVAAGGGVEDPPHVNVPVTTAAVAVATGDGIRRIFYSLGVQRIVTGGQSMNPSTAQLLEAVESAPAAEVVILPNNKNIIAVAEQVQAQTTKVVRVIPTRGITEGFAALVAYDPEASSADNLEEMTEAASNVLAGEVTRAVRDSSSDVGPIRQGDYLGITRDGIIAVHADLDATAIRLLEQLVNDDHEIVTIIEGEGATRGSTRAVTEWLGEHHPDVTAEVHHGGQPLYPYLFGVE
ncbi:MAG: fatty acid kinase [Acidimicrobiaceae bacterium]|jgi:DAK2 domain fusion protein YloV